MTAGRKKLSGVDDTRHPDCEPPPTHHTIICKHCHQPKVVPMKITRICRDCVQHRGFRDGRGKIWTTWGEDYSGIFKLGQTGQRKRSVTS